MTAAVFDLTAKRHESRVLARFNAERQAVKSGQPQAAAYVSSGVDSGNYWWGGVQWDEFVRGGGQAVGVNERAARSVAAVVACVNLIGGSIGSMPLHFYRNTEKGPQRIKSDLWWMFNERPSEHWSASAFWQYLSDSRGFHGDGFAKIKRASRFSPVVAGFEPWHPLLVTVRRVDGRLRYTFHPRPNVPGEVSETLDMDDVLHIPGAGYDGVRSVSQLQYGLRLPAGIAYAADEQSGAFIADGARPDYAFEVPGAMNPEQRSELQRSWIERHTGQGAKRTPVVLAGGIKLHQLTLSAQDSQLLSTRAFQIEEICRIFGVPPFMIGHTEKTTSWGSGIEQMSIGFVKYTLQRHLVAFEQEINHKLFRTARNYAKFLTAGLERADLKTRAEAHRIALGRAGERAWMTLDEVRALEDLPPSEELNAQQPAPAPTDPTPPPADPAPAP